jgi:hypothetical protein
MYCICNNDTLRSIYSAYFHSIASYGIIFWGKSQKSRFAQHLLETGHSTGPIDSIMEIIHPTNKGRQMDTIEKFHIYKITYDNIQINDKNTSKPNAMFDTIIREEASIWPANRETPP